MYIIAILILVSGLYFMLTRTNLFMKVIGLAVFQNAVLVFYIAISKIYGAKAPILEDPGNGGIPGAEVYSNPLPHVLMLTAIVVGFATLCVALSLVRQIKTHYSTTDYEEIKHLDE
jgi:multicomponent Na+:H+ antiporter subunit C